MYDLQFIYSSLKKMAIILANCKRIEYIILIRNMVNFLFSVNFFLTFRYNF